MSNLSLYDSACEALGKIALADQAVCDLQLTELTHEVFMGLIGTICDVRTLLSEALDAVDKANAAKRAA